MTKNITNNSVAEFSEIIGLIHDARQKAYKAVNTLLVDLYWQVGQYISIKIKNAEWGDAIIPQLASHIAQTLPGLRGFTRVNLFRMRQFYETYCHDEIISPLVRQLPWTHNLIILSQSKSREERLFYVNQTIRENWSKRDLERQLKAALFERAMLHPQKSSKVLTEFRPEALGKLSFYLEALDQHVKKQHENPAIGILLCANKDEVVEFALNRTLSPAVIAEYKTQLPDKKLLREKLHEFFLQNEAEPSKISE